MCVIVCTRTNILQPSTQRANSIDVHSMSIRVKGVVFLPFFVCALVIAGSFHFTVLRNYITHLNPLFSLCHLNPPSSAHVCVLGASETARYKLRCITEKGIEA